jgi:hypothetical protein
LTVRFGEGERSRDQKERPNQSRHDSARELKRSNTHALRRARTFIVNHRASRVIVG